MGHGRDERRGGGVYLGRMTVNDGAPTGTIVEEREPTSGGEKTARERERDVGAHIAGRGMEEMSSVGGVGGPHGQRRRQKPPARLRRVGREGTRSPVGRGVVGRGGTGQVGRGGVEFSFFIFCFSSNFLLNACFTNSLNKQK
jgi:hypothetical protein